MCSKEISIETKLKDLSISDKYGDIKNILLVGETGVGKSTFINSIANYFTYKSLEQAENQGLLVLIPSEFQIRDKYDNHHLIKLGSRTDLNENLNTGVSATQGIVGYIFPKRYGKFKIRIIDTPGMGDTRGIEQDNRNCDTILRYLAHLRELHAICFLLKPTNARITAFFDYCFSQILCRLHKNTSNNLVFLFTNTRGSDYGPGDTLSILHEFAKKIKEHSDVVIPLKTNCFSFDNEGFRYLAALKDNVEFDKDIRERNRESWKASVDQFWSFIHYINGELKVVSIENTLAVHKATKLTFFLSQLLAEISQNLENKNLIIQRHHEELNRNHLESEDLKKKLTVSRINVEIVKLNAPRVVCTSQKCAEVFQVDNATKWHYKQVCHDSCFDISTLHRDIVGPPDILNCKAIDKLDGYCIKCNCYFSTHMVVCNATEIKEDSVKDPVIEKKINKGIKTAEHIKELIDCLSASKNELERDQKIISTCCSRIAYYLRKNAIIGFSNSYGEYIEYLLSREKISSNKEALQTLEKLLRIFEESKRSFENSTAYQGILQISQEHIQEIETELYKLKGIGSHIRDFLENKQLDNITEKEVFVKYDAGKKDNKRRTNEVKNEKSDHQKQFNKVSHLKTGTQYKIAWRMKNTV